MANVDWIYLAYSATAFAVTYIFLVVIFSIGLAIYHWGLFLTKLNKKLHKDVVDYISSDEDTGGKLKRIARKYSNVLEKTQEETQEEDSDLEKTQEEIVPHKTTSATVTAKGTKLKKKSSVSLTAKSDTNVVVSHLERESLLHKTQEDD